MGQSLQALSFRQMTLKQVTIVSLQALQCLQQPDVLRVLRLALSMQIVVIG